jgi:phosphonopyruvate decarboxylase
MIAAQDFVTTARTTGFDFYTGVPCSLLTSLINEVIADKTTNYVGATSEGEACGIAAGAWLAGRTPVVMLQNSGLGNTINPLTSLNHPFRIPSLMLVTWRGEPGIHDEPQHVVMGEILHRLLDTVGIAHAPLPTNLEEVGAALQTARDHMNATGLPFAFVVRKGQFGGDTAAPPSNGAESFVEAADIEGPEGTLPTRFESIASIVTSLPADAAIVATTGKTGRELFTFGDREQQLYLVGSMGCASAVGLGVALNSDRPVVVLDGDGAALMKLGNLATIGAQKPAKLIHVVLDNGVHDSTGGQATVSSGVDLAGVAASSGYRSAVTTASVARLPGIFRQALAAAGPHFIRIKIAPGSIEKLGRPTVTPPSVARRFRHFLTGQTVPLPASGPALIAAE